MLPNKIKDPPAERLPQGDLYFDHIVGAKSTIYDTTWYFLYLILLKVIKNEVHKNYYNDNENPEKSAASPGIGVLF